MGLGGVISNLLSLGAKLLPAVKDSAVLQASSSRAAVDETHKIEAELEALMRMLKRINTTLYDAEQREIRDESVKLWLEELKGVAYDAEDVLDEYHYEVLRSQVEARDACTPDSRKRKLIQVANGIFDQIKQIRNKFSEIEKDRIALRLSEEDGPHRLNNKLHVVPTSHITDASSIFGREREKEKLIDLLCSEPHDGQVVSVVSIVGTGGVGKTTLAQLAYNDLKTRQRFDRFGWVCVSEDFSVERLTRELVESITRETCDLTNMDALHQIFIEVIRGEKILLVLDDVWNEKRSLWELFQVPLRLASFVKILVTTRNVHVAEIMQTEPSFHLGYLSEEQCWGLFEHYAFGGEDHSVHSNFIELGKQIMKKCGMLPLAVKSIACLLRHEPDEESWREILESELWETDASNEIFPPLQISYARLPTHLKPCLRFCSIFPKDFEYDQEHLLQLWISQGYIESKGKKNAQNIGLEYATQLRQRSLFESRFYLDTSCRDTCCKLKLHDMIHDMLRSNSKNECWSIETGVSTKLPDWNDLYHLCIASRFRPIRAIPFDKFTTLRTLIMRGPNVENYSSVDLSITQKLRALEIGNCNIQEFKFNSSVGNLKHLRYLSLGTLLLERLPESISSLYNLRILKLKYCAFVELPRDIGNLVSLEELEMVHCNYLESLPESFCQLTALKRVGLNCGQLDKLPTSIGNLVCLEKLEIRNCYFLEHLPESVCQLKALRELTLINCNDLEELPSDMAPNLRTLNIMNTRVLSLPPSFRKLEGNQRIVLDCETLGWLKYYGNMGGTLRLGGLEKMSNLTDLQCSYPLASMCNLDRLQLGWNLTDLESNVGMCLRIQVGHNVSFEGRDDYAVMAGLQPHHNLKELQIYGYDGSIFPEWVWNPSICASLKRIVVNECKNLMFLPFGSLQKLKYLTIIRCDSLQFLSAESLPLGLQELSICFCANLISVPGIQNVKSLLDVSMMDAGLSVELTIHTNGYSSHQNSPLGLRNLTSLRIFKIKRCPNLRLLAVQLLCVESCKVEVNDCPLLRTWCLQHNINYTES